jgi:uncharacterized damage-inducible protein DinB
MEGKMALNEALLVEFDQEMAGTRKTLECVPDDKLDWRPHGKSGTMRWLAGHLADLAGWAVDALTHDSFDLAPQGIQHAVPAPPRSCQELLERFDKNVSSARAALASSSDAGLRANWSLLRNGAPLFTMPRLDVLRRFILNHTIHHRAQLGVYLRLNDIPVPALYGPSADEGVM